MSNPWDWGYKLCDGCGEIIEECICYDLAGYEDHDDYKENRQMKTTDIEINGQEHTIEGDLLTYELIAELARLDARLNPSIVYKRSGGKITEGILYPGDLLAVVDGTSISAYVTGNS